MDWRVGSGRRSRTYVTLVSDAAGRSELLEHRWSWYADGDQWAVTLGHPDRPAEGIGGIGRIHSHADTLACFGCHATAVPVEQGQIEPERIVPGIRCDRCHRNATQHATAVRRGQRDATVERLGSLSPLESVNRCGECHRRADQLAPDELVPTNLQLVRFAGAALVQSPCFKMSRSDRPLTCLTCHDPHGPAETDPLEYAAQCGNCHTGRSSDAPRCSAERSTANCIACHMPKLQVAPHLEFTDHWIRVRSRRGAPL